MDGGFSEAPPPSASQSAPACIPVEEQELCSVSELVDYPSWRPSPRLPDDRYDPGCPGNRKRPPSTYSRGNRSTQHYDPVVNGPAEFTERRQYLPDGETQSIAEEVSVWHRNAQNNSS